MRIRSIMLIAVAGLFLLAGAAPAIAQQAPLAGECNGEGAMPNGMLSLAPPSGPAGSTALFEGAFEAFPGVVQQQGPLVEVWWLETGVGDAVLLTELPFNIEEVGQQLFAMFSGNVAIPAGAQPGPHDVAVRLAGDPNPACISFTVTETVQQDGYPDSAPAVTRLPETGLPAPMAAAFLIAAGGAAGAAAWRRLR